MEAGPGPITLFGSSTQGATRKFESLEQRSYSRWIQCGLAVVVTAAGIIWLLN